MMKFGHLNEFSIDFKLVIFLLNAAVEVSEQEIRIFSGLSVIDYHF